MLNVNAITIFRNPSTFRTGNDLGKSVSRDLEDNAKPLKTVSLLATMLMMSLLTNNEYWRHFFKKIPPSDVSSVP